MNSLENDLLQIYIDITKGEYYMVDLFWTRAKEKVEKAPAKEFTTKAKETMAEIFTVFIAGIREDYNRTCDGKKHSLSNKDLDKLESHYQEILGNIDKLNEKFPRIADAKFVSKTKEGIKFAREANKEVLRDFADINDEFNSFLIKKISPD